MTSLQDKLKELGVQIGTSQLTESPKRDTAKKDLLDVLPGSWETTPVGDCFVVRKEYAVDFQHGSRTLAARRIPPIFDSQRYLAGVSDLPLAEYLFIDTETTGLAGGTGTYVFLIGAAKIVEDQVHFAQFFLQDPGLESAQLAALENFAANTKAIVSYNGKSFDLPRIKTRFRFHGWPDPFREVYHLDLLHIARRIWKDHLQSCTLGDLEHHILELERDELDIPGWKIAEFFFAYLQDGDPHPLKNILYHNEIDVLSLIALLGYLAERLSAPLSENFGDLPDLVPLGKYLSDLGDSDKAAAVLSHALSSQDLGDAQRLLGLGELAGIYKKASCFQDAVPLWEESAQIGSLESKVELAKYYEHQVQDYQEAIHWTLSALDSCGSHQPADQGLLHALEHRLSRLKRKSAPGSA